MDAKTFLKLFFKHFPGFNILPGSNMIDLLDDLKRSQTSIDQKVERVSESLKETSIVIDELESELLERASKLKKLQQEYERYSNLSSIGAEEASAVMSQLEESLGKGKKTDLWYSFLISILSGLVIFILGIIFSPMLTSFFSNLFK